MQINRPESEQDRIDACIGTLAEAFDRKPTDAMLTGYQLGLLGVPVENIEAATLAALQEPGRKFMPKPGELRELCGASTGDDRAILAWTAFESSIGVKANSYDHVDFDDPLINATVRSLGGWPQLLDRSTEDFDKFVRPQFLKTYAAFYRTGCNGDVCRPLAGLSDTGRQPVTKIDGTVHYVEKTGPKRIETGLPALPQEVRHRIGHSNPAPVDVPAIQFREVPTE